MQPIAAAEEVELPTIIMHAQCHEELCPLDVIGPIMVERAKKARVPVCVMLDHGEDLDYLKRSLEMGFTAVMYDGSTTPYEENVKTTCEAVKLAASYGADVEAEFGSMGKSELGEGTPGEEDDAKIYTDPDMAKDFVAKTGITALACSFGTTHGIYLTEPKLNFDIVKDVRAKADGIPVVMHGGSGVSEATTVRQSQQVSVRLTILLIWTRQPKGSSRIYCICRRRQAILLFSTAPESNGAMKKTSREQC